MWTFCPYVFFDAKRLCASLCLGLPLVQQLLHQQPFSLVEHLKPTQKSACESKPATISPSSMQLDLLLFHTHRTACCCFFDSWCAMNRARSSAIDARYVEKARVGLL